jgi:HEPN domain
MNPLTQEWIDKAEGDFRTATREIQVTQDPSYDGVCFHAQQCVEKYLKLDFGSCACNPCPNSSMNASMNGRGWLNHIASHLYANTVLVYHLTAHEKLEH